MAGQLSQGDGFKVGFEEKCVVKAQQPDHLAVLGAKADLDIKRIEGVQGKMKISFSALGKQHATGTHQVSLEGKGKKLKIGKCHPAKRLIVIAATVPPAHRRLHEAIDAIIIPYE